MELPFDTFAPVLTQALPPGNWVAIATVSSIGGGFPGDNYSSECELRNTANEFIGGTRAAPRGTADTVSLTMNGGIFIPSGIGNITL